MLQLIWAVHQQEDMRWVQTELERLYKLGKTINLEMNIFVTRESFRTDAASRLFERGSVDPGIEASSPSSSSSTASSPGVIAKETEVQNENIDNNIHISSINTLQSVLEAIECDCNLKPRSTIFHRANLQTLVHEFVPSTEYGLTTVMLRDQMI